jgi:hypothetical protein
MQLYQVTTLKKELEKRNKILRSNWVFSRFNKIPKNMGTSLSRDQPMSMPF